MFWRKQEETGSSKGHRIAHGDTASRQDLAECRSQSSPIEAENRKTRSKNKGASLRVNKHAIGCMARLDIAGAAHRMSP